MAIYETQIKRHYPTLQQAWYYLSLRGFNCLPFGDWENGRWVATVRQGGEGCDVLVWLRTQNAFSVIPAAQRVLPVTTSERGCGATGGFNASL